MTEARQDEDMPGNLVREHLPSLRGYLASLGAHVDLIDDLAQDVFLEALSNFSRYDESRPFRSWLFGIARNLVHQEFRKSKLDSRIRRGPVAQFLLERRADVLAEEGPQDSSGMLDALRACLQKLGERSRHLISLRFVDRHKSEQIGTILNMKASAVRVALMRARTALRLCVERNVEGFGA